ncbi:hypothetical protein BGI07_00050 [Snodgrassella alvi]|nr:hypothetical protein BGI07_00050 [Snodgrassella alvi]ORF41523.1 hypothetical protein BGI13_00030 [Snodgrassella alvi]
MLLVGADRPAPITFNSNPPAFHCDSSFSYFSRSSGLSAVFFSFSLRASFYCLLWQRLSACYR